MPSSFARTNLFDELPPATSRVEALVVTEGLYGNLTLDALGTSLRKLFAEMIKFLHDRVGFMKAFACQAWKVMELQICF